MEVRPPPGMFDIRINDIDELNLLQFDDEGLEPQLNTKRISKPGFEGSVDVGDVHGEVRNAPSRRARCSSYFS